MFNFVLQHVHIPAFNSHFLMTHNTLVSQFTFVLQHTHLLAFHNHFLIAHNIGSPFSFMLQCAHLLAFHSHFLTAHNTSIVFLKNKLNHFYFFLPAHNTCIVFFKLFFESHFSLSFSPWNLLKSQVS